MNGVLRRIGRWFVRGLVGVVVLLAVAAAIVWTISNRQLAKRYPLSQRPLVATAPSAERGEHLARALLACSHCHGADLGGDRFIDSPAFGRIPAPNLTRGSGGIGARYREADWERAIRHGIGSDGRGLLVMPSSDFAFLADADVADLIAYLANLPPVDRELGPQSLGPIGRLMLATGPRDAVAAERIDHSSVGGAKTLLDTPRGRGSYLASACAGCHDADYAGRAEALAPDSPPPANLTPDARDGLGAWTREDFGRALRTGRRPDGTAISDFMPWRAYAGLTDPEIDDLWAFLRSLPARPSKKRA